MSQEKHTMGLTGWTRWTQNLIEFLNNIKTSILSKIDGINVPEDIATKTDLNEKLGDITQESSQIGTIYQRLGWANTTLNSINSTKIGESVNNQSTLFNILANIKSAYTVTNSVITSSNIVLDYLEEFTYLQENYAKYNDSYCAKIPVTLGSSIYKILEDGTISSEPVDTVYCFTSEPLATKEVLDRAELYAKQSALNTNSLQDFIEGVSDFLPGVAMAGETAKNLDDLLLPENIATFNSKPLGIYVLRSPESSYIAKYLRTEAGKIFFKSGEYQTLYVFEDELKIGGNVYYDTSYSTEMIDGTIGEIYKTEIASNNEVSEVKDTIDNYFSQVIGTPRHPGKSIFEYINDLYDKLDVTSRGSFANNVETSLAKISNDLDEIKELLKTTSEETSDYLDSLN